MTTNNQQFQPSRAGITAFMDHSKVDFVFQGPNSERSRLSVPFDSTTLAGTLNNKPFEILEVLFTDSNKPKGIKVRYGRLTLTLGRRWNASGAPSFYRSVGPTNTIGDTEAGAKLATLMTNARGADA